MTLAVDSSAPTSSGAPPTRCQSTNHSVRHAKQKLCTCPDVLERLEGQRDRERASAAAKRAAERARRDAGDTPDLADVVPADSALEKPDAEPVMLPITRRGLTLRLRRDLACRGEDPELFDDVIPSATAKAKAICWTCNALDDCLTVALQTGDYGVLGATTYDERQAMRSRFTRRPA